MNRKQKKLNRLRATRHKDVCKWLKGGVPRKYKNFIRSSLGLCVRLSRKELRALVLGAYLEKAKGIDSEVLEL